MGLLVRIEDGGVRNGVILDVARVSEAAEELGDSRALRWAGDSAGQEAHCAALGVHLGITESAYNVRDLELTYQ